MDLIGILNDIRDARGSLTPEIVLNEARDSEHPLHSRFDWDDTEAAEKWRLQQAGQLLRVTYRPDPSKPSDLRAFVAIRGGDSTRSEYVPTGEAFANPFTRELVLRQMNREWQAFKARYQQHAEFAALISSEAVAL